MTDYLGGPGDNFTPDNLEQRAADAQTFAAFNEDRWRRAGASDEEVAHLRSVHGDKSVEDQTSEGRRLAGLSDGDLANELEVIRASGGDPNSSPYKGNIDHVLGQVGNDADLAREALAFERSGFGKNRKTLIEELEKIIAEGDQPASSSGPTAPQSPQAGTAQDDQSGAYTV